MLCKERLEAYLDERSVPYQEQWHPAAYTAQEIAQVEHVPGRLVAKVVLIVADDNPMMFVVPADYRVHLTRARVVTGAKELRLAHEHEFQTLFPDCEVGAMPPFGNLYGLPVYVDEALAADDLIIFQAGTHTDTMSMKYDDFARLVRPTVAEFAVHEW